MLASDLLIEPKYGRKDLDEHKKAFLPRRLHLFEKLQDLLPIVPALPKAQFEQLIATFMVVGPKEHQERCDLVVKNIMDNTPSAIGRYNARCILAGKKKHMDRSRYVPHQGAKERTKAILAEYEK